MSWQLDRESWNQAGRCAREACQAELRESWRHPATGLYYCTPCHRLLESAQFPMKMELVTVWTVARTASSTSIGNPIAAKNPLMARTHAFLKHGVSVEDLRAYRHPTDFEAPMRDERVLCAAIYCDDGKADPARGSRNYPPTGLVFGGYRHSDCFTALLSWSEHLTPDEREAVNRRDAAAAHGGAASENWTDAQVKAAREGVRGFNQGFLTTKGRFVSREEAFDIAERTGQLPEELRGRKQGSLTSEDLY